MPPMPDLTPPSLSPARSPAGELASLRADFGLPRGHFARLLGIGPRTLAQWELDETRSIPDEETASRLGLLAEIRDLGVGAFGANDFGRFLRSRQPLLEGRVVLAVLEGEGRAEVSALLRGIIAGRPA